MKLLLTGGTGFFGRALLRYWQARAALGEPVPDVTVLCRQPVAFQARYPVLAGSAWLTLQRGDILEPAQLGLLAGSYTHLLHAAADSTAGPAMSPLQRYTQIVDGTRHMLDVAIMLGIPRFLQVSSGGVYGPQPADLQAIPESYHGMPDPMQPAHAYSVAKRSAEHLCALYQEQFGVEVVIARCFAFVGRDLPLDAHFAIGNFIGNALSANEIRVNGDGSALRTFMDQRDLAHWLDVLLARGAAGQAYNVGSDQVINIGDLAHLVRDLIAPGKPVLIARRHEAQGSFRNRYVPQISKATDELGLTLQYSLVESIRHAAEYAGR